MPLIFRPWEKRRRHKRPVVGAAVNTAQWRVLGAQVLDYAGNPLNLPGGNFGRIEPVTEADCDDIVAMGWKFVRLVYRHGGFWQGSIQDGRAIGVPGSTPTEPVYAGRVRTAYHDYYKSIFKMLRDRGIYVVTNFDQNCMQYGRQSVEGNDYCVLNGIGGAWNSNATAFAEANAALAFIVEDLMNDPQCQGGASAVEAMVEPFPDGQTAVAPQGSATSEDPLSPNYIGSDEAIRRMYVARRNVIRAVPGLETLPIIVGPNAYQSNRITQSFIAGYPNEFIYTINTFLRTGGALTVPEIIADLQDRVANGVDYSVANGVPVYFNSWGLEDENDTPDRQLLQASLEAHLGSGSSSAIWEYKAPNFATGQGIYWLDTTTGLYVKRPEMYDMIKGYYTGTLP